jgi:CheY-like chemotaxis protein/chemotaxis signal transduction protein
MSNTQQLLSLLCRVSAHLCALPLEHVVETLRPLPVEFVCGAPEFVSGLSIVRSVPLPVVDTGSLLGEKGSPHTRFVIVKAGDHLVVLALDEVLGLRAIPADSVQELPPLLGDARADLVAAIGAIDARVLAAGFFLTRSLTTQIAFAVKRVQNSSAELQSAANKRATGAKEQATAMNEITTTIRELLATSRQIVVAPDGEEALDYSFAMGSYLDRDPKIMPDVVLPDLKLPKVDGLGVPHRMRSDIRTRRLPVVVLTSSNEESDIIRSYDLGANSFVQKPVDFARFLNAAKQLGLYWLGLNEPPPSARRI